MLRNFNDFCAEVLRCGFTAAGGSASDVFSILHSWNEQPEGSPVVWHTGEPETDPWEWRIRVLDERDDIAYAKVFFRAAGYISREWYPYFLAARRGGVPFDELYAEGKISHYAKRIYDILRDGLPVPLHELKTLAGFGADDKSRFDKALTDLQMGLFITMCGRRHKLSKTGEEYGWASTVFCSAESFWPEEVFNEASQLKQDEAIESIRTQIFRLNPNADAKRTQKFILG